MTRALKEWHVVSEAIARGDQVITLRKGGIGEKEFAVAATTFWLYPTWEHQTALEVERAWHGELARSNRERPTGETIPLRCHCSVEGAWEVTDEATLASVAPFHLWTSLYAQERLAWRPTQPLTVLLLRASALVDPFPLPASEAYGGCRSWIDLDVAPDNGLLIPSLTDDAFSLHADRVRHELGAATVAGQT